jgi:Carboxypeptidase regulatory-like domain
MWIKAAFTCLLAALLAGGLFSRGLFAQGRNPDEDTGARSVQGVVTDAASQPVAKAVVQLKNTKTLQIRSFITGADGMYHFAGLSGDVEYQLKAEHEGTSTSWKTLSMFNTKKLIVINLKLNKRSEGS